MTLAGFIDALRDAGADLYVEDILDTVWLATQGRDLVLYPIVTVQDSASLAIPAIANHNVAPAELPEAAPPPERATPAPEDDVPLPVYASGGAGAANESVRATPVTLPAGHALPGRLALSRALRPFRARWPSRHQGVLDEYETAEATAKQDGDLSLVFRPLLERWFDVDVVLEDDPAIGLWQDTVRDFSQMLREMGTFRIVRFWRLRMPSGSAPSDVTRVPLLENVAGGRVSARVLSGGGVRRLVFFVTHGSSARWLDGSYARVLEAWSRSSSIVLLHLLDRAHWKRTALGEPHGLCYAPNPGATSAGLHVDRFWWTLGDDVPASRVQLPAVSLDPAAFAEWARMEMSRGRRCPVFLLDPTKRTLDDAVPPAPLTAQELERTIAFLRETAPESFRLAVYLSAGPFTIPVARLVQEAKFGAAAQSAHLAGVLLSGLVFARSSEVDADRNELYYEFHQEARAILLRSLRGADADFIASALEQSVSRYIEQIYGRTVSFRGLVPDENGQYALPGWAQPFARLGLSLLGVPAQGKTGQELVNVFRTSNPVEIVRQTVRIAISQSIILDRDSIDDDVWHAMVGTPLVRQNPAGEWIFLPGVGTLLADFAPQWPLLGKKLLWVDDHPTNNKQDTERLSHLGATIEDALTTKKALSLLDDTYHVVISDMTRGRDREAGLDLLRAVRERGLRMPLVIYAAGAATTPTGRARAQRAGAFGCTDDPEELIEIVLEAAGGAPAPKSATRETRLLSVFESVGLDDASGRQLLHEPPGRIALTLLGRISNRSKAFQGCLDVIRAFSGAGVNQLIRREGNRLTVIARAVDSDRPGGQYTDASWDGLIGRAAKTHEVVWVPDVTRDSSYIAAEASTRSELALPVFAQREAAVVAVVNIELADVNTLTNEDIAWLNEFCAPIATRIATGQPRAFISFASADASFAERIVLDVSARVGLPLQHLRAWPDREVNVGDTVLLLLSANSVDSVGEYKELPLRAFDPDLRIVPMIIDDSLHLETDHPWAESPAFQPHYESGFAQLIAALGTDFQTVETVKSRGGRAEEFSVVELVYATDRLQQRREAGDHVNYGPKRGRGLTFGMCQVSIPATHRLGRVERASLFVGWVGRPNRRHHVTILRDVPLIETAFLRRLSSSDQTPLIFVHGYNSTFQGAVMQAATRWHDLNADVLPIAYSWPSAGRVSAYLSDEDNAEWTSFQLTDLLRQVGSTRDDRPIHIWSEGLGVRPLLRALEASVVRLGQIILYAPDADSDVLHKSLLHIQPYVERVTVYLPELGPATLPDILRGRSPAQFRLPPGVDTITVPSSVDSNAALLADIAAILQSGIPPEQRFGLTRVHSVDNPNLWSFRQRT
jgi:esterase/lipase superfamily enzyme/CheY-like chemotaxis protein